MKLNNPQTSPKLYWSIIKSCYNGRKIPIIPPLSVHGKIIANFKEKANLFNKYFSPQCNPLPNDSQLPENQTHITETKLSTFNIEDEDIYKIIKTLDINKTHGHNEVSIRMLKLCDKNIVKSLSIIFKNCKLRKAFPTLWKKANVVPITKKGEKYLIKNYCPVSLLPILGNFFERLIFNSLFKYIDENELLNPNQSGFCPFDSCVNQLLSINHEVFSNFDCNPPKDICAVFSDISKAFDKIWLPGLIFKIKSFGTSGDLLELIKNFLSNRFQRVVLSGQMSEWGKINAGVPQSSILGLLFFLIYINDLTDGISSIVKLFAHGTSLFSNV